MAPNFRPYLQKHEHRKVQIWSFWSLTVSHVFKIKQNKMFSNLNQIEYSQLGRNISSADAKGFIIISHKDEWTLVRMFSRLRKWMLMWRRRSLLNTCWCHDHISWLIIGSKETAGTLAPENKTTVTHLCGDGGLIRIWLCTRSLE